MCKLCGWLLVLAILGACTCGGRTECVKKGQISFLTNIHDDTACERLSNRGVMIYEAAKYIVESHNNKTDTLKIDLAILDTCGTIAGSIKATMKALVWSDINCLRPPFYLGFIGPESALNVDAVQKITTSLSIPHIVKTRTISPFLHYVAKERDPSISQGILEIIEALRWKSFTLVTSTYGNNEDDIQHIAKKVTMGSIARGICVMIHDDDEEDFTAHVVHIGKPNEKIFKLNATILIASEGNLKNYINRFSTLSNILLLEDPRNDFPDLEDRVENSRWWSNNEGIGKYDAEELRDVRWLNDAIQIYIKAFDTLCAKHQCSGEVNPAEWNTLLSTNVATYNTNFLAFKRTLELLSKRQSGAFEKLANVAVQKNHAKIHWNSNGGKVDKFDLPEEIIPDSFKILLTPDEEKKADCATSVKDLADDDDSDVAKILFDGIDEHEWWTMLATVGGVGVSMFAVGIFAVYIVITNIRGPRTPKAKSNRREDRDTSLRRIDSDRDLQIVTTRPQRPPRENQRRDSSRSIGSNFSEKSV